jgi:hypothetical protein
LILIRVQQIILRDPEKTGIFYKINHFVYYDQKSF